MAPTHTDPLVHTLTNALTVSQTVLQTQLVCSTLSTLSTLQQNWAILLFLCPLDGCVWQGVLADSAAMRDPSLFHDRPSTQVLIPHGSVCLRDAQCGPYSAAREVVTCGDWNCGPEMGPWLLCGGFPHANCNYHERRDMSFGKNVGDCSMKLLVRYRKSTRLLWQPMCIYVALSCTLMDYLKY